MAALQSLPLLSSDLIRSSRAEVLSNPCLAIDGQLPSCAMCQSRGVFSNQVFWVHLRPPFTITSVPNPTDNNVTGAFATHSTCSTKI